MTKTPLKDEQIKKLARLLVDIGLRLQQQDREAAGNGHVIQAALSVDNITGNNPADESPTVEEKHLKK
ncbi:MAG: hypothetical protein JNK38_14495 [Acidobacteria bacterium]|nr:hypothetical protein [Acidobacteriota bacterium]